MSANSKLVLCACLAAIVSACILACSGRFDVVGSTVGPVMVDRWTGSTWKMERGEGLQPFQWERLVTVP